MARIESQVNQLTLTQADDFKLIHGIGPGIESRLHAAGIRTYAQLATMTPEQVVSSLGKVIGLTSERVSDQNWIGQAHDLAPVAPADNSNDVAVRQHYATYTVELLLSEDKGVRRTRMMHIQSKTEETWAGWDEKRFLDFVIQRAELNLSESQASRLSAEELTRPERNNIEPLIVTPKLSGNPRLGELRTISLQTGYKGRILPRHQPFEVDLTLDMTKLVIPDNMTVGYAAQFFVKAFGNGARQKIGEALGAFTTVDTVEMSIKNTGLKEGTYRISVDLALSLQPAEPAAQPELMMPLDGGLLQVY